MNFDELARGVSEIVSEPTGNLTAAVLLVAMLVLLVLMVVVALLLLITPKTRPVPEKADEAEEDPIEPASAELTAEEQERNEARVRRGRITTWLIVGVLMLAALATGYVFTGRQDFCADACHSGTESANSNATDAHAGVRCVACHEDGSLVGVPGVLATRLRYVVLAMTGREPMGPAAVPWARCFNCHDAVRAGVIEDVARGVRISHAEPLAAGMGCQDCHIAVGHAEPDTREPGMAVCVRCHDGEQASADCAICHTADAATARTATRVFGKTNLPPPRDCGGCHSQEKCDECHGLRLPHSVEFETIDHAKQAAFGKKELCMRCHEPGDCASCHIWPMDQHPENWRTAHTAYPFDSPCGCHQNGPLRGKAFCPVCHN